MFEREIKFIYDFNLNKLNRLGPYFTFEQLLASDIHPAILQYISAEIDYLIYEDRQKLLKNSLFDYSGEKISFHFNQISEEAKKSKRFAQEYIAKLILHASSFTINYLVRPKWTLTKFVFDEDNHKSTNDIKQILNYVYYYKYVNKILVSYINSKKILSMNSQEFEELLNKADRLGVETYLPAILTSALKSMAEFFNIGEIQKTKIPLSAVEMFLEEKELFKHLQKVDEIFVNEEGVKFNLIDYHKVFNSIVTEKEEQIVEPEVPQKFETKEDEEEKELTEELDSRSDEEAEEIAELQENGSETLEGEPEGITEVEQELEEKNENKIDHEQEDEEKISEDEINEISGEEITITPPVKYRIKINEDSRIEPLIELPEEMSEQPAEINIDDEESNDLEDIESEEEIGESFEENESESEPNEQIHFKDELELAEKGLVIDDEEDESFLQSLRDKKNLKEEGSNGNSTDSIISAEQSLMNELEEQIEDYDENYTAEELIEEDESERVIFDNPKFDDSAPDQNKAQAFDEQPKMDLAEILEHKDMTKIIEVIFDYDIEDFAGTLDEIATCRNEDDAHLVINNTLNARRINRSSKEAQAFRSIISEYFSDK